MFEPSVPEPAKPPPPERSVHGAALRLVQTFRAAQRRRAWLMGVALGGAIAAVAVVAALVTAASRLTWAGVVAAIGAALSVGAVAAVGGWWARRTVGDDERTAVRLGDAAKDLGSDLLAAVELTRALPTARDFSPALARAFLADVDRRATRYTAAGLLDPRPLRAALGVSAAVLLLTAAVALQLRPRLRKGWDAWAQSRTAAPATRAAITGDFTLEYHYPEHTHLEPRTITGTSGEVSGPAGTEVLLTTRADRSVDSAALEVNGQRLALDVKGRTLSGRFILSEPGQYHVVFLDGRRVVAEGPDLPIRVTPDLPPRVELTAPDEELEIDAADTSVRLSFHAADDYGLSSIELVFQDPAGKEQRLKVRGPEGKKVEGSYTWALGALNLKPGAELSYALEAKDNDTVHGPNVAKSQPQLLRVYSAQAHRRKALEAAEALWERLVTHLADRAESSERTQRIVTVDGPGRVADLKAKDLAVEMVKFGQEQQGARDPVPELGAAFGNAGAELSKDTMLVTLARRPSALLTPHLERDLSHSERNVLYLESLLDRRKLEALKELAEELRQERREFSRLLDEFAKTKEDALQQQLLQQMNELKRRMAELQARMAELHKGIRDEHVNSDALKEMLDEMTGEDLTDDIEKLLAEGKTDEAIKRMQELAMKMDEMVDALDDAQEQSETDADPELARKFQEFTEHLEQITKRQQEVAGDTASIKEAARKAAKERLEREAKALQKELAQKLDALDKDLQQSNDMFGDEQRSRAREQVAVAKQAVESGELDLAREAVEVLAERVHGMEQQAERMAELNRRYELPPELRREQQRALQQARRTSERAEELERRLDSLFPKPGEGLSEQQQQQLQELGKAQQQLAQEGQQLQQQLQELSERAPIFDENAKQSLQQAGQRMGEAAGKLASKDPSRGHGLQQGALESLEAMRQQLEQMGQRGGGGGMKLPLPYAKRSGGKGDGRGVRDQKVEIPDEDPNAAARDLRQHVMEAMKQGAPERYRDQNKRYYEDLVK